ncbi:MAG TPA: type I 3-dehydroquinate dehydratase [Candidatus Binatia bacterium]|nr:type I 3-dehydroquinate dehydratase [Candidatus Binatia bacterium]
MTARICVSILPKNKVEALNLIEKAEIAKADFIEVRLDCLEISHKLSDLSSSTKIPLIATNKLQSEKGYFAGTESERQQTLLNAAKNGFEYVDVDLANQKNKEAISKLEKLGTKQIISYHKFDGALSVSAMEKVLNEEIACGASVCKIVTTAKQVEDNLPALSFVSFASSKAKLVCFCMGEHGRISRLLSPVFGAFFTFASLEQGNETVAGQMSIGEMRSAYTLLGIK